ncbi:MAG: DALR domain-containing protein, partial [Acidaminococcaceae bacterium]
QGIISVGPTAGSLELRAKLATIRQEFLDAMRDDFNTALAISHMFALAREINIYEQSVLAGATKPDGKLVDVMTKIFAEMCSIIGVLEQTAGKQVVTASVEDELMTILINLRQEARQTKNYAQADALRDQLAGIGITIEDTPQGVRWKRQ